MAVETLKNYLVEPRHRIRLSDMISQETETVYQKLFSLERFPLVGVPFDGAHLMVRLREYEAIMERLQALFVIGAAWGEQEHLDVWRRSLERIANPPRASAYTDGWRKLMSYPALRLLYGSGLAAIVTGRFQNLRALMEVPVPAGYANGQRYLCLIVNVLQVVDRNVLNAGMGESWILPTSEYLFNNLRESMREYIRSDDTYEQTFDALEYLIALVFWSQDEKFLCPLGRFAIRLANGSDGVVARFRKDVDYLGTSWPPLAAGFFGGSVERFNSAEGAVMDWIGKNQSFLTFGW